MNTSCASQYENSELVVFEDCDNDEAVDLVINDILKVLDNCSPVTYCPLCVSSFDAKSGTLSNHLRSTHLQFLWELTRRSISLDSCPLCTGKFVGHHLVAKHALMFHGNVLVDAFFEKQVASVKCVFCYSLVSGTNIIAHVGEWHMLQFVEWFTTKFRIKQDGVTGLVQISNKSDKIDVDDLNNYLQNLNVNTLPKSILKTPVRKSAKPPVRRGLSFDDESNKENCQNKKKKTPIGTISCFLRSSFQCGKCGLRYASCTQLEAHIKKEHKKVPSNMLQRFYKCSQCGANFFKISYLKKHVVGHSLTKLR